MGISYIINRTGSLEMKYMHVPKNKKKIVKEAYNEKVSHLSIPLKQIQF